MELLLSNIQPSCFKNRTTVSCFENLFSDADGIRIASGYISTDSLAELKKIFEMNKKQFLEVVIGMHGFDGFTRPQYEAAKYLDEFLRSKKLGGVKVSASFRFHGKMYSFLKDSTPLGCIAGSSNLNSIFDNENTYETDFYINESKLALEIDTFIKILSQKACTDFNKFKNVKFIESPNLRLDGHYGVKKVSKENLAEIYSAKSNVFFDIPIKADDAPYSNLNVYFGRGRINKKGFVKPRHWYEVELIVPSNITRQKGYPKAGTVIDVYTDDGWKFKCKISGDFSKNFRSYDDLKILGRWIKVRLENSGALKTGQPVTKAVLKKYGRDNFTLSQAGNRKTWILDFGVK